MKRTLLTLLCLPTIIAAFAQPVAFTTCPNVSTAILRSGTNADVSNPISIYTVNPGTGAPTLLSGPILDPANTSVNLQLNGIGLNPADGFLYGLYSGTPSFSFTPTTAFYRIGANAEAVKLGTIAGPAPAAPDNASIVNAAAGEMDVLDNYYFSAATGIVVPNFGNPAASTFTVTKLFIGKLSGTGTLAAGNAALSPAYIQITNPSNDASAFLTNISTPQTISTAQNSGLRDLVFNQFDSKLYTYVTYPDGSSFVGQMLKVDPTTGVLTAVAAPVVLPFASASNEVAGTLLDQTGNFLILFTDGTIYKANSASPGTFDGSISLLNNATGLPSPLRGDMASCGSGPQPGPLPLPVSTFNAYKQNNSVVIKWQTSAEININKFIVEKSTDGVNWAFFSEVSAQSINGGNYQLIDNNTSANTAYYRVIAVKNNNSREYSNIKKVSLRNNSLEFSTYPNPVINTLTIEGQQAFTAKTAINVIDAIGKTYRISSKKVTDNTISINLSNFSKGVYYIHITTETGAMATRKFIKM